MKLICFDCDSTLSSLEGIDELARLRGPDVYTRIEALTRDAMNGTVALEQVFGLRLGIIKPGRAEAEELGRRYVETVEPTASETIRTLKALGWTSVVISAGYRQAIRPLADLLGIERIEAVDLFFNPDGTYRGYASDYPATRTGGKPEIVGRLRAELNPERVVMVGDGVSDLETRPVVDLFVGYGGYVTRERVKRGAAAFVTSLSAIPALL